MPARELLREALRALRAHALRSTLTLLGVIIGVATLVAVVGTIAGLNVYVRERIIQLAPDVYVLTKFGVIRSREAFLDALKRKDIDWNEYRTLESRLKLADAMAAEVSTTAPTKFRGRRLADVEVHGTTAAFATLMSLDITAGRYFIATEDDTAQPLAVIGWDVKDELYGQLDPIGREVLVGGMPYRVIGLIAKQGRTLGQSQDNRVYLPMQAFRRQFGLRDSIDVLVKAHGGVAGVEPSADEVRAVMRALRHTPFKAPDPFGIVTAEQLQTLWRQISAAAYILSILIALVSLGVGGVVITNIMLVAVVERTREIGVRLAMGATKAAIRRQFLLEAAMLSLSGGIVGALIGSGATFIVRGALNFPATITPAIVGMGLSLSLVVGIVSGYFPARAASNLVVVDALRTE